MAFCIDTDSPEFISLVDGLRDKLGINAEFEAKRDIYEHNGEFRTPKQILDKLAEQPGPFNQYADLMEGSIEGDKQKELLEKIIEDIKADATSYVVNDNRITIPFNEKGKIKTKEAAEKTAERIVKELKTKYADISPNLFFIDKTITGGAAIKVNITDVATANYIKQQASYFREDEIVQESPLENTDNLKANEIATKIATRLSEQLSLPYEILTPEQAKQIDPNYNGEVALFLGGKVYFIGSKLSTKMAFHEFSHPLLRSINIDNNPLFQKLYSDLIATTEGASVLETVQRLYPDLLEDNILGKKATDRFKEEVLVHALTIAAQNELNKIEGSTGFSKTIQNIMYAIKQLLRKIFGQKVNVSKLDVNTTLNDLGEMLAKGDNFQINTEVVSKDDVAAYSRSETDYLKDLNKINNKGLQKLVDDMFETVAKEINFVEKGTTGEKIDFLVNQYKAGGLQKIKKQLAPYTVGVDAKANLDAVDYARQQASALLNSLNVLQNTTAKIHEHLKDIEKDINRSPDKIQRMSYYQKMLNYWEGFIDNAKNELKANRVDRTSGLYELVNAIDNSISGSKDILNDVAGKAVRETIMNQLRPTIDLMEEKYQEQLSIFKTKLNKAKSEGERKAGQAAIDKLTKDYDNSKITSDTIEKSLKGTLTDEFGKLKDVSWANHFFEGAGYNTDAVFGGLNLYVQNNVNDVIQNVRKQANEFGNTMAPLLEKIGYNKNKPQELGEKLGQKEKRLDQDGKEQEVWVFKNELTGYQIVKDNYLDKIHKAKEKFEQTGLDADRKALGDVQEEWAKHKRDFWHDKYTPEFYAVQDILSRDAIGKEAALRRNELFNQLTLLQDTVVDAEDEAEKQDAVDELYRQIRRLSNLRDEGGHMKTGMDLAVAERLQAFAEAERKLYRTEQIPDAFQEALSDYEQRLIRSGKNSSSDAYKVLRQQWLDRNTRVVIKPEFYEERSEIFDRITEIMSHLPKNEQAELDISKYWEEILELTKGYRDADGQPVGAEMTEEKLIRIKALQKEIDKSREKLATRCGLTKKENYELNEIFERILGGEASKNDSVRLQVLMDRKSSLGLNRFQRVELNSLYSQLGELQKKVPTDSYVDTMNAWLSGLDTDVLYKNFKINSVTVNTAGFVLQDSILTDLFRQSSEFEKWFNDNHILKPYFDQDLGTESQRWERIYAWNVVRPNDSAYYETTTVTDVNGVVERIQGIPTLKYFKRLVKDGTGTEEDGTTPEKNYFTPKVVGKTVDNKGGWLPKQGKLDGAVDDRYLNQEYLKMKQENSDLFKVLDKMKEFHLKHQEDMDPSGKLYLDMPRYEKGVIEAVQSGNLWHRIIQQIREFFQKVKNGWDTGMNFKQDAQLATLDIFDDDMSGAPISGKSNIELEKVSTDIAYTMMRYLTSGQRQKKLIEMLPVAKALQSIVNNEENAPIVEKSMKNRTIRYLDKKKDTYMRAKAVNNYIEREFEGQINKGWGSESAIAQNLSKLVFKQASTVYLTLNLPSAIKNAVSAKFQGLIEAVAGRYMSPQSFAWAEGWSARTTMQVSANIYTPGSKPLDVQIVEVFDPAGKTELQIGESMSRSLGKDLAEFKWTNDFRRWTELQSTLQIFGGMMKHQKVEQNGKMIAYVDAWELKDGQIKLKDGIDKAWEVGGTKFVATRNRMQNVVDNLNGAFRKEQTPEGQRYLAFRAFSFLRRWLPSLIANRFAYSGSLLKGTSRGRTNLLLSENKEGFYITTMKLIAKTFTQMGRNWQYMTPEERAAGLRFVTEIGLLMLMSALIGLMGYDADDEDRYKKLRALSGAAPFFGLTEEDPTNPFNLGGFIQQHALLQLMQIKGENQQYIPLPGLGLNQYLEYVQTPSSLAFGPNLKVLGRIAQDLAYNVTGDDRAYYKRTAGGYTFQQQGENKIWAHLASSIGLTGSSTNPAQSIKNFQTNQQRTK